MAIQQSLCWRQPAFFLFRGYALAFCDAFGVAEQPEWPPSQVMMAAVDDVRGFS
jgi:hypothetical protein